MSIPLVSHPNYSFDFPHSHRFPMEKFRLLYGYLQETGVVRASNTFSPEQASPELLQLAHCPDYLQRFFNNRLSEKEMKRMGLPWSEGLLKRSLISPSGTFLTARIALKEGIACHLAGGTHHAHYDFASGFCVMNDLAITARALLKLGDLDGDTCKRVLIFDCDVHQGDGTARILENESSVFTCSIHCDKNFPAKKARSDLDVEVQKQTKDDDYLAIVAETLEQAIELSSPDIVLYDAGVDIYEHDPLGLLSVSEKGIRARDHLVLSVCRDLGLPVATVIGGGYDDDRKALARRHAMVVEEADRMFKD